MILITDLDGTLLNDNKVVTRKGREALIKAEDAGHNVILCSGRNYEFVRDLHEEIGLKSPFIANNGAVININGITKTLSFVNNPDVVNGVIHGYKGRVTERTLINNKTIGFLSEFPNYELMNEAIIFLSDYKSSIWSCDKPTLEVTGQIDKSNAINYLCKVLKDNDYFYFGDEFNDIKAMLGAYCSIAPANHRGLDDGTADIILDKTNNEDAIPLFILENILGVKK